MSAVPAFRFMRKACGTSPAPLRSSSSRAAPRNGTGRRRLGVVVDEDMSRGEQVAVPVHTEKDRRPGRANIPHGQLAHGFHNCGWVTSRLTKQAKLIPGHLLSRATVSSALKMNDCSLPTFEIHARASLVTAPATAAHRSPLRSDCLDSALLLMPPAGLEPATRCLEGSRSIQLSYGGLWEGYGGDPASPMLGRLARGSADAPHG